MGASSCTTCRWNHDELHNSVEVKVPDSTPGVSKDLSMGSTVIFEDDGVSKLGFPPPTSKGSYDTLESPHKDLAQQLADANARIAALEKENVRIAALEKENAALKEIAIERNDSTRAIPRSEASQLSFNGSIGEAQRSTNGEPLDTLNKKDASALEAVDEAISSVDRLTRAGEWGEAEAVLLQLLDSAASASQEEERELWARIKGLPTVKDVLNRSRIFWDGRQCLPDVRLAGNDARKSSKASKNKESLEEGFPGWTMLPKVRIDYCQLLPGAPAGFFDNIDPDARILWRVSDGKVQIKVLTEFPSRHPTMAKSFVLAFLSMWAELDKWHTWNPVIPEAPRPLRVPTLDFMTWEEKTFIRFIKKEISIGEMNRLFTPDGVIVQKVEAVLNPQDERMNQVQPPPGYSRKKEQDRSFTIMMLGCDKTVVVVHYEAEVGNHPPSSMLLNLALTWVMPTIIKKMFKIGADIFKDAYYAERHVKDPSGLYARIGKAESDAQQRERLTGHKFHSSKDGHRIHTEAFRSGDLFNRTKSF